MSLKRNQAVRSAKPLTGADGGKEGHVFSYKTLETKRRGEEMLQYKLTCFNCGAEIELDNHIRKLKSNPTALFSLIMGDTNTAKCRECNCAFIFTFKGQFEVIHRIDNTLSVHP